MFHLEIFQFLSNVEVYNPVDDSWEDGIPLTSGRSGLASAVIYQPSCSQNYSQDSVTLQHSSREYDERRTQHNPNQSALHSSMHLRHSNFDSRGFSGDSNQDDLGDDQVNYCDENVKDETTFIALKKLKISEEFKCQVQSNTSESCPIHRFSMRIKKFMHYRTHPCKLKATIFSNFNPFNVSKI